jgi:NAD(P)-dependent dehydrogenase (short-subunit alcohol dehydrogenase family)
MTYFVTGATGFIGRYLVRGLLQRGKSTVYVLVRPKSMSKLDELREFWGKDAKRVVAIKGDLAQPGLGVSNSDLRQAEGQSPAPVPSRRRLRHPGERRIDAARRTSPAPQHALEFSHVVRAGCLAHS